MVPAFEQSMPTWSMISYWVVVAGGLVSREAPKMAEYHARSVLSRRS